MDGIRPPTAGQQEMFQEPAQEEESRQPQPQQPQTTPKKSESQKSKISVMMGFLLIATALLFDGCQFVFEYVTGLTVILLPLGIVGAWVIDIIAWLTFFLWFHSLGLGTIKKGGMGASLNQAPFVIIAFAFGIEFIPFINALPGWTAAIVTVILKERTASLVQFAGLPVVSALLEKMTGTKNKPRA